LLEHEYTLEHTVASGSWTTVVGQNGPETSFQFFQGGLNFDQLPWGGAYMKNTPPGPPQMRSLEWTTAERQLEDRMDSSWILANLKGFKMWSKEVNFYSLWFISFFQFVFWAKTSPSPVCRSKQFSFGFLHIFNQFYAGGGSINFPFQIRQLDYHGSSELFSLMEKDEGRGWGESLHNIIFTVYDSSMVLLTY